MSKKIQFIANSKYGFDTQLKPYPAIKSVPDWWKNTGIYDNKIYEKENKLIMHTKNPNWSFKKCTPMLDAIGSGYIIPLWADVLVSIRDDGYYINWKTEASVFELHGRSASDVPPPVGYVNTVFKYLNTWIPITPKGYSCLITSPFGYRDLPVMAIPAIIDTDKSLLELVPPMWIKEGFEGVIEKGTPLVQITPFKRESWESEFSFIEEEEHKKNLDKNFNGTIVSHYIKNVWSKKEYK